jgi:high affinity sulfate transporter 1
MAQGRSKQNRKSPFLRGLLPIDKKAFPSEVIAGLTLAAIAIPEVMGYTRIAGTPVVTGIYTILFPVIIFALFGASRHLVIGADSATAAILAHAIIPLAAIGSPEYMSYVYLLSIMVGVLLLVCRLLRLGFIGKFLSRTVLAGFLAGIGVLVALGQLGGMLGIQATGDGLLAEFLNTLTQLSQTNLYAAAVAGATLAIIVVPGLLGKKFAWLKKIPWPLIALAISIVVGSSLIRAGGNLPSVGSISGGLPHLMIPAVSMDKIMALLPAALTIVVVIITQSAATAYEFAGRHDESVDINADIVGLGLANISAGLSGTFIANGSPTKTQIADNAGGRSQLTNIVAAGMAVVVLLFLTGLLEYLPVATLSALVFVIGIKLIDIRRIKQIYVQKRDEFYIAIITAGVVVAFGAARGIVFAIILALIKHIYHSCKPKNSLMVPARLPDGHIIWSWQPLSSRLQAHPGLIVYHFAAPIYYANAETLVKEVLALAHDIPELKVLLLDFSTVSDVDYTGGETLIRLYKKLKAKNISLHLTQVENRVMSQLKAYGLVDTVGKQHIHHDITSAVKFLKKEGYEPRDATGR